MHFLKKGNYLTCRYCSPFLRMNLSVWDPRGNDIYFRQDQVKHRQGLYYICTGIQKCSLRYFPYNTGPYRP